MKVRVARRRAGTARDVGRVAGDELAAGRVETVDEHLVEALIGDDDDSPGAIEGTVVRVRAFLRRCGWRAGSVARSLSGAATRPD
jgi:hypothetical protein